MASVELTQIRNRGNEGAPPPYPGSNYENKGFQEDSKDSSHDLSGVVCDVPEKSSYSFNSPSSDPDEKHSSNKFYKVVHDVERATGKFVTSHNRAIRVVLSVLIVILYFCYFGYAMSYSFGEGARRLLVCTILVFFFIAVYLVRKYCGEAIEKALKPCTEALAKKEDLISWVLVVIILLICVLYVVIDSIQRGQAYNLVSFVGIFIYIFVLWIFSVHPGKVRWRPVVWGMALQLVFGLIILRWQGGYNAFKWLGDRVSEFLEHTDAGSAFVFGADFTHHFFAFKVLTVIIFFSTAVSVLYYLGVMQLIIEKIAWIMQKTMGTTAAESLNAAGNIFIGQSEAPLMIRPLLPKMSNSELHSVMTGGFATIAGSVFAAYVGFNVPANHLISASVMSAPAALAMSKLSYPETDDTRLKKNQVITLPKSKERNMIEAASNGATSSIALVANIGANLIAFIAMLHFVNATLCWFGARVGIEPPNTPCLSIEFIFSYVLWPFALVMGVVPQDCRKVAELMGVKTVVNEFVAYKSLGDIMNNKIQADTFRANYSTIGNVTETYIGDNLFLKDTVSMMNKTLVGGTMQPRSEVIATYALCGFANFGSIGIMLGALGAMIPKRRQDLASMAMRSMIAGNVACFMTACVAGLLYLDN